MKKRKDGMVKTSTLIILLIIFFVFWTILLIGFLGLESSMFLKSVGTVIIYIFCAIILSLFTVSTIAVVLQWKI